MDPKQLFLEPFIGEALASSPLAVFLVVFLVNFFVIFVPFAVFYSYVQSKVTADMQARIGIDRIGPYGSFQIFSDFLKLLLKGSGFCAKREFLPIWIVSAFLLSLIVMVPMSSYTILFDSDLSSVVVILVLTILSYLLLNFSLNQPYPDQWLGGFRGVSQSLVGGMSAFLSLLAVGVGSGGLSWSQMVKAQGFWPFEWSVLSAPPFMILSFLSFYFGGLVFLNLPPFDNAQSIQRTRGSILSARSGLDLGIFYLNRFFVLFLWCVISSIVFLGGWSLPVGVQEFLVEAELHFLAVILQILILLTKTSLLVFAYILIQRTFPKVTARLTLKYSFWVLIPMGFVSFFAAVVYRMVGVG